MTRSLTGKFGAVKGLFAPKFGAVKGHQTANSGRLRGGSQETYEVKEAPACGCRTYAGRLSAAALRSERSLRDERRGGSKLPLFHPRGMSGQEVQGHD